MQHEINIIKQEISELKHRNRNNNNHIKPELMMLKVVKLIIHTMSTKMEMNPVNRLFFLIKVLLMFSMILKDRFVQLLMFSDKGITDVFNDSQNTAS